MARLHRSRADYALDMGRLFAPFTEVAAANPHAMSPEARTAEDLATVAATPQSGRPGPSSWTWTARCSTPTCPA